MTKLRLISLFLKAGIAVPFFYFGIQLIAAPFFPGYSFIRNVASELGSDRSPLASFFNVGIFVQGVLMLIAACGFWLGSRRTGVPWGLAALISAAVFMGGLQSMWAAHFPMPDPRHGGHPLFLAFMIAMPFLLGTFIWKYGRTKALRTYVAAALLVMAAIVLVNSGVLKIDASQVEGLKQRVLTLTIFPLVAVAARILDRVMQENLE
ncbi:DUF998 domain-containing protein [Fimbriimonas ginsengisoli]|uniref:DUF998 domain-containing protein n=1 Tax=Fimbriimonas ginsengisoli Gsoil 348 TaxID=661478 RepID=A0A068NPS0_FIMGI|nr:DUF998 domain-containing protein [Fimbriimonas ginsengisoli]AIE84760.1 hypothetical protein OP10G_1392 [Fimbriimonas ginsengisoli Gsoil 348]